MLAGHSFPKNTYFFPTGYENHKQVSVELHSKKQNWVSSGSWYIYRGLAAPHTLISAAVYVNNPITGRTAK